MQTCRRADIRSNNTISDRVLGVYFQHTYSLLDPRLNLVQHGSEGMMKVIRVSGYTITHSHALGAQGGSNRWNTYSSKSDTNCLDASALITSPRRLNAKNISREQFISLATFKVLWDRVVAGENEYIEKSGKLPLCRDIG